MTLIDLQRRIAEVGRIRIGQKVPTSSGKSRPGKLSTFRLTSPDRNRIAAAADLYGGTVAEWQAPSGKQWEVVTDTDSIPVIVPPTAMAFSQAYEQWAGGGCQVRCDGAWDSISDKPCHCDPDERECKPHTRLSVMLRDVSGLGVWRIDTSGYYAAVELAGAVEIIGMVAQAGGGLLPASLRLEQRSVKRPGEGRRDFAVPVLDIEVTPAQLVAGQGMLGTGGGTGAVLDVPEPERRLLEPVPDTVPHRPVGTVADQVAAVESIERVRRGSVPVAATGLAPRPLQAVTEPEPDVVDAVVVDDDTWSALATLLGEEPDEKATMAEIEEPLRRLFSLMETVGLWPSDSIHKALATHYGVEHLADLRKANLVAFAARTWEAARAKFAQDTETGGPA